MLIDWFTVGAQVVNFLVLVWLLQRFLYRPVLAAIDAREQKIAAQLADATSRETQARAACADFQQRCQTFERERNELFHKAADEAEAERRRLIDAVREESQSLRARLDETIANERQELSRRLATRTQEEVFALTSKVLTDLAGVEVEERMVDVFIGHLRSLPDEQRRKLTSRPSTGPVGTPAAALVRSAFELTLPARTRIKTAVTDCLGSDIATRFETSPGLVCGIELTFDGVKLAWSVADYLSSASESVLALVTPTPIPSGPILEARHA